MQRSFLLRSFSAFTRGVLAASVILLVLSFLEKADARPAIPDSALAARSQQFSTLLHDARDASPLMELYRENAYQLIWHGSDSADNRRNALQRAVELVDIDGLNRSRYLLPVAEKNQATMSDIETSRVLLRLIADLSQGQTSPSELGIEWDISKQQQPVIEIAREFLTSDKLERALDAARPAHKHYQTLRTALLHYRSIAMRGGWKSLPNNTLLKPGAMSAEVAMLRERLSVESGSMHLQKSKVPTLYDSQLEVALTAFQRRHGLTADGIVGRKTVAELNVPVEKRIRQIALNLERWRWLPRNLGERHILVNTAEFTLALYENDQPTLDMRVVVGKTQRQTPIVSKAMKYLVLNPTWTVPPKILHDDIVPKLAAQPDYLQSKGMRVFDGWSANAVRLAESDIDWSRISERHSPYRVEQAPGAQNALGQVKFMFPNQHSVYIHDTPSRSLFAERVRAFSSGCVRVEHPMVLAKALLASNKRWQAEAVQETLDSGRTTNVILKQSVPVHLVYLTAWVNDSGELHFRNDIYKRDQQLQLAMLSPVKAIDNS